MNDRNRWPPKLRPICSINIADSIRRRELGNRPHGLYLMITIHTYLGTDRINGSREFYHSIHPRVSVLNVEKPACILRKFTPDGRYLLALSASQTSLLVYEYRGVTAAGQLFINNDIMFVDEQDQLGSVDARHHLFDTLFRLEHTISIVYMMDVSSIQLHRDFCLITNDSRHVLIATAQSAAIHPNLIDIYHTNESLEPSQQLPMEDITIYCIDIINGRLCDQLRFKCDRITLAHNQGVYLFERLLAILSLQHQIIHLYQIDDELGTFIPLQQIGRFLYDDDDMLIRPYITQQAFGNGPTDERFVPMTETVMTGVKHRLFTWLYREAKRLNTLSQFFTNFDYYRQLRIWRMQMLDSDRFLLRFTAGNVITSRSTDPNSHLSFYVIYDWKCTQVLAVYDCYSRELLRLYEQCADRFRHPDDSVTFPCSMSSCYEASNMHQRLKRTLDNAKGGGEDETIRRILAQLPLPCQSFALTPYFDVSMFSYDDKLISQMERTRMASDSSVRFFSRRTNRLAFQLQYGIGGRGMPPTSSNTRNSLTFIFHPSDPLALSIQRNSHRLDSTLNMHLPLFSSVC